MGFDEILQKVGAWGRFQWIHVFFVSLAGIPIGMHSLANVFYMGPPDFACTQSGVSNFTVREQKALVSPFELTEGKYDTCKQYKDLNYSSVTLNGRYNGTGGHPDASNVTTVGRCSSWAYDREVFGYSAVERWDLVCSNGWKRAMSQSIYMMGFLIGAVGLGILSDKFGRKTTWLAAYIILIVFGVGAAFVPSYWAFVLLRCVTGMAAAGAFTNGFVLVLEMIGPQYRVLTGCVLQCSFATGYVLLTGVAYAIPHYMYLQLTMSLMAIAFALVYFVLSESPRWLMTENKMKEAGKEVERMARINRTEVPTDLLESENKTKELEADPARYGVLALVKTPRMRLRALNVFFNWFVNALVYYGLSMGVSNLAGSPHLNLFISGVVEYPAIFLAAIMLDRIGRRWSIAGLEILGGVACLLTLAIPDDISGANLIKTTLSMIGKFGISGSFAIIYIFTAELFPTVVRNVAVGTGSMHARIGGLIAPFIAELGHLVWKPLPGIIFGASALAAGLLVYFLPETLNEQLPETIEDGELFGLKNAKIKNNNTTCASPQDNQMALLNKDSEAANGVKV